MKTHAGGVKFKREFTKDQLRGKHHATLPLDLNVAFLAECDAQRRGPSDMIRIILEDRYASEIHYPNSVEAKPHGGEARPGKRDVA